MLTFTSRTLTALGLLIVLSFASVPPSAYACSGEPLDPNEAAVIAEGRVERVTVRPDLPAPSNAFTPVEVTLRVERFLKGRAPNPLTFVDPRTAFQRPDGRVQWGSGGACGILNVDPTGQYALIVFRQDADGRLTVNLLYGVAVGAGPDDPLVGWLRQRIITGLQPGLPNTGGGGAQVPLALPVGPLVTGGLIAILGVALSHVRLQRRAR